MASSKINMKSVRNTLNCAWEASR